MKYKYTYSFPIGQIILYENDDMIVGVKMKNGMSLKDDNTFEEKETINLKITKKQLDEYFQGKRTKFDIPIYYKGTDFQVKVWEELRKIPYGNTCSYGEIAYRIGVPNGQRAVGMANNKNPLLIIVPCHRVISKNGGLTGFAAGIDKKEYLLNIEKSKD